MRRGPLREWSVVALGCALWLCAFGARGALAREVVDATGKRVQLVERPARIVALAPSLGELAADFLGADLSRIVGVSEYTDYPPALTKVASVGSYARFNLEKVVALKPELVLAWLDGNSKEQVMHLRELGLPVVVVSTEQMGRVGESMRLVGQAMGLPAEGERLAKRFEDGLAAIRRRATGRARKTRVLLQVGDDPFVTAGKESFLHGALEAVGAQNIYGDSSARYPRPSMEDVVKRAPEMIIVLALGGETTTFEAMAKRWSRLPGIPAVRTGSVRVLRGDAVVRPTARLLEGLAQLEKTVYGK